MTVGRPRRDLRADFDAVEKPEVGCWIWPFSRNGAGRAMFRGKSAPRELYKLLIGPVPDELGVLHTCDNPACVRPDHWFVGNQQVNVDDAIAKGRFKPWAGPPPGEGHHLAKLTTERAMFLKSTVLVERAQNGGMLPHGRLKELQREFDLSSSQICRIVNGKRWGAVLT